MRSDFMTFEDKVTGLFSSKIKFDGIKNSPKNNWFVIG